MTRSLIQELKTLRAARSTSPQEGLIIYRRNGVEAFTDLATVQEVQKNADLAPEVVSNIEKMRIQPASTATGPLFARALETLETQEALTTEGGVPLFVVAYPIKNQDRCQGCHGSDHTVRAVVRVATSMAPVFAEVRHQRNRQIVVGVLTIVAAAIVLTVAMRRIVVRPIRGLARVASRIGDGDFSARAVVTGRDEIGQLGQAFNNMTTSWPRLTASSRPRTSSSALPSRISSRASAWRSWSSSRASSPSSCPTRSRSSSRRIPTPPSSRRGRSTPRWCSSTSPGTRGSRSSSTPDG